MQMAVHSHIERRGVHAQVAQAVLELQEKLPKARVLYCSATGVSEVGNLAYMTRLGLWGPGTSFADFGSFLDSMKQRGVSFLEMLAMEMKVCCNPCCMGVLGLGLRLGVGVGVTCM